MPSHNRRAAARRRAWGRGPIILRFESLEGRQLLTASQPLPDLVGGAFDTLHNLDWGNTFHAVGKVLNQGDAAATGPFNVEIFASTTPVIGPGSVPLGEVTIPATPGGLQPGQTATFDQVVALPATPIPGFSSGNAIYVATWVDPEGQVAESNKNNNLGVGQGYDTSVVAITPTLPSQLDGSSLGVYPDQTAWGQTVSVTAQVRNDAQGNAPPTRARIVLTPSGTSPGSGSDVTVGYLQIPAIAAWQTANVTGQITLPAAAPQPLAGATQFTLSMIQDSDYLTNPLYPHQATQGLGLDMTTLTIGPGANANLPKGPLPDLAVGTVLAPTQAIAWGQSFQVQTTIQNLGQADSAPFHVEFLLTGAAGTLDHAIYLGAAAVGDAATGGIKKGYSQDVIQTLRLPARLPNGVTLDSIATGRIAVVIDPDNAVDEQLKTNNIAESAPVTLRVLGTDGSSTVPTAPPASVLPLGQATPQGTLKATKAVVAHPATKAKGPLLLHRATPHRSITSKVEHNLRIFPKQVTHYLDHLFKKKKN